MPAIGGMYTSLPSQWKWSRKPLGDNTENSRRAGYINFDWSKLPKGATAPYIGYGELMEWGKRNRVYLINNRPLISEYIRTETISGHFETGFKVFLEAWGTDIFWIEGHNRDFNTIEEFYTLMHASACKHHPERALGVACDDGRNPEGQCDDCGVVSVGTAIAENLHTINHYEIPHLCRACSVLCPHIGCRTRVSKGIMDTYGGCAQHSNRALCSGCQRETVKDKMTPYKTDYLLCYKCVKGVCLKCQDWTVPSHFSSAANSSDSECVSCAWEFVPVFNRDRIYTDISWPGGWGMGLPNSPARPIRAVSYELEMDGNSGKIATTLAKQGLVFSNQIQGYSTLIGPDDVYPAVLTRDASVTGGELKIARMDLSNKKHAQSFLEVLGNVQGLVDAGHAVLSQNAGGHIHMDATGLSMETVRNLTMIFNHVEDVLFRIAGGNVLHRSLAGNSSGAILHRKEKEYYADTRTFWDSFAQTGRNALNIANYMNSFARCVCAAHRTRETDWYGCTCSFNKNTIEWRLFNASTDPRIVRTWISLMQSITALAQNRERDFFSLPDNAFTQNFVDTAHKAAYAKVLQWMSDNLILSASERLDLVYTIAQSELNEVLDTPDLLFMLPEVAHPEYPAVTLSANSAAKISIQDRKKKKPPEKVCNDSILIPYTKERVLVKRKTGTLGDIAAMLAEEQRHDRVLYPLPSIDL